MTSVETPPAAPAPPDGREGWSIEKAKALYNVEGWGAGYFDVSERGRVIVRPDRDHPERSLDLFDLAKDLQEQGVGLPVLLRFSDILRSRIESLSERFASAVREFEYGGGYTTVYPIKVNQQRHVVEEIVQFGSAHGVGLECGSKPELQAVLGLTESSEHLIVCNGYKDEEFMRLALMGQKLGHRVFIVIEQLSEVDVLLAAANDLGVQPMAGVRIKLSSEGAGRWAQSGGERSKFGLSAAQVMKLIDRLRAADRLDLLKLIHFHIGSQVTDIRYIKSALQEIARYYVELRRAGVDIAYLDVGGGLGVDYDGTSSTSHASVNYSLQEYANDVVYTIAEVCRDHRLPMPHLISESGRALTAHHALLLVKVIDVESQAQPPLPEITAEDHPLLQDMIADFHTLDQPQARRPTRAKFSRFSTTPPSTRSALGSTSTAACSRCASARWRRRSTSRRSIESHSWRSRIATPTGRSPRSSTRCSWIAISATFRSSSRSPIRGRSISSFRSCRCTAWTSGRIAAGRCRM